LNCSWVANPWSTKHCRYFENSIGARQEGVLIHLVDWSTTPTFTSMFQSFEFCIPSKSASVPVGEDWLHEVKYDGYRLRLERDCDRVGLITRGGYNWTDRYPWIVEAALKNRQKRFVIDGEAVILDVDGISDFNALHSGRHNEEVQLFAFDILAEGDDDLRKLPPLSYAVSTDCCHPSKHDQKGVSMQPWL
jgi:ATP-dependent DNA ligase